MKRRWAFVDWSFENEAEFIHLAQLKDLLDHSGIDANLTLDYLPYGRQDKQVRNDQTFALRTFARLVNCLNFNKVFCLDPHSGVAGELINNFCPIVPLKHINKAIEVAKPTMIAFPDKGAAERYGLLIELPTIYADKIRNQSTGEITKMAINGDPKDQVVLIVDDICDGGMTFIKLAELLNAQGAKAVHLFTTHGIYSKGIKPIKQAGIIHVMSKNGLAYDYHIRTTGITDVVHMPFDYVLNNYNYMETKENQCG